MIGETVIRIRAGASPGNDRYGNPLPGVDVETAVTGAAFEPRFTSETVGADRLTTTTKPALIFFDEWPDLLSTDRVRVRGVIYEVDGVPADYRSPFGTGFGGVVVELKHSGG